jgi:acetyl esterase
MDDSPVRGPSARRTDKGASAKPATAGTGAKARVPGRSAKSTSTRSTKATKATKATKSATTAVRRNGPATGTAAPTGPVEESGPVLPEGPGPGHERGQWRGVRSRALYSRRIQRFNERWPLAARGVAGLLSRPELVLAALGRPDPVERDGRVLNRGVQALLELAARVDGGWNGPDGGARPTDPAVMRTQLRRTTHLAMPVRTDIHAWGRLVPGPDGAPAIPVRLYRQYGSGLGIGGDGGPLPGIVYYHGGSWVTGDLDTHDATCRMLAATARCLVVAVDYRLAPEHPFPAAVDDAAAAYVWVQRHADELGIDPHRVGVMGDSAGGNLAAVVALEARAGGRVAVEGVTPPAAQGLIYPAVDARLDTETVRSLAEGFFLTSEAMVQARSLYLPDPEDWTRWQASPLLAEDHRGVAPALVVTAGFDPLRDDGSNYAEALRAAGVAVEYRCYDDQVHGFMGMGILPDSLALATEVCDTMGRLLRRSVAGSPTGP